MWSKRLLRWSRNDKYKWNLCVNGKCNLYTRVVTLKMTMTNSLFMYFYWVLFVEAKNTFVKLQMQYPLQGQSLSALPFTGL